MTGGRRGPGKMTPSSASRNRKLARMLQEIEGEVQYTRGMTGRARLDPRVVEAIASVPRHRFVGKDVKALAYANHPLPIGAGQTISQPYIVAIMTELLDLTPDSVVLEIGTGSGYQAAILSRLVKQVYTIEIIRELGEKAAQRLRKLGYDNVTVRIGDGYRGWPEHAPYDAIMVTAACPAIPSPLIEQLKVGGKMMIPLGQPDFSQELMLVEKKEDGGIDTRPVLPVAFVPLTGDGVLN